MLLVACGGPLAAESPWETIEWERMNTTQRFRWALDLYRMGRPDESAVMMQRVIASAPNARTVARAQDLLTPELRADMLANPKTTKAVQDWAGVYQAAVEKLRFNDGYISEMVDKLTGDLADRELAMTRLNQLSEFAVPHVIRMMANTQKAEHRVTGGRMLLRLDRAAVLPMIEYLHSSDDSLRVVLLELLGELRDVRALAAVSQLAGDREAAPALREAALRCLARIVDQVRPGLRLHRSPEVNYLRLADAYLHEKDFTLSTMAGENLPIWKWSDEKKDVTRRMTPRKLYIQRVLLLF